MFIFLTALGSLRKHAVSSTAKNKILKIKDTECTWNQRGHDGSKKNKNKNK